MAKWIIGVESKLSKDDGYQLLKILYYKDDGIDERDLDAAKDPKRIYKLSKNSLGGNANAALSLLIHRVRLLVPRYQENVEESDDGSRDPIRLFNAKDLGAQACLDYLIKCRLPPAQDVQVDQTMISEEAKLLECLVTAYVNLSPRKRGEFRDHLTKIIGYFRGNCDLFNHFTKFLRHEDNDSVRIIASFVNILNNIRVPRMIPDLVQNEFNLRNIDYPAALSADDFSIEDETEADYINSDTTPLLSFHEHHYHRRLFQGAICTRSRVVCCLAPCLPILLFAIAVTVSTAPLSTFDNSQSDVQDFEISSILFDVFQFSGKCSVSNTTTKNPPPPLIHLGTVKSQWYDGIKIMHRTPANVYTFTNMTVYFVPSEIVKQHLRLFSCSDKETKSYEGDDDDEGVVLLLDGVYLFSGANMTFNNMCIISSDYVENSATGSVNLTIYDSKATFEKRDTKPDVAFVAHETFYVNTSNETKCYTYYYVTLHNGYYYVALGANFQVRGAVVTNYELEIEMKYVNASDWSSSSAQSSICNHTNSSNECLINIQDASNGIDSVFKTPKDYDIFAHVTTLQSPQEVNIKIGYVSLQPTFRKVVYAVPSITGLAVFVPFEIVCVIFVVCHCRRKKRTQNISYVEELDDR